jgi:hypothetical protein
VLLLVALLVLLIVWALNSVGGDGGSEPAGDDHAGGGPAESITPGPTPSESFIDERPGGREEPSPDDGGNGGDGDSGGGAGGGGFETDEGDGGVAGGESGGTTGTGTGGTSGGGEASGLPACGAGDVTLSLSSEQIEYGLDEEPELTFTVENVSGVSCAVDFGYGTLTVTVTDADAEPVWSSADCPEGAASAPTAVWAGGSATHTITWDRRYSTGDCESPDGPPAAAGASYLAEATLSGFSDVPQASFRLDDD